MSGSQGSPLARQYHLQLEEGDVAPTVLLPGDPGRVPGIAEHWDESRHVATNREYVTYTGSYQSVPISCTSTGIGCPSTAIALEELARVGATTFIRVGTCGTFRDEVELGDIAIFDSAVRLDGTSRQYAPLEFPAVASHDVVAAAIRAAAGLGVRHHVGTTRSGDAFYAGRSGPGFAGFWQSSWANVYDDLRRLRVSFAEMEASVIFVLARVWGLRAGGISVVGNRVGEIPSHETAVAGSEFIERLASVGCEVVHELATADSTRP